MTSLLEFVFSSAWVFTGTLLLLCAASFGWALTFYWLTRYRELMQDKILRELEIARLERYEFEKLLRQMTIQDPFKQ